MIQSLRINRAAQGDIPYILKTYQQAMGEEEISEPLTIRKITSDILVKEPSAFINFLTHDNEPIGFIYYMLVEDRPGELNVNIYTLSIDDLGGRVNVQAIGRTVLNYIFMQHRGISGVFARSEQANRAIRFITNQPDGDFYYNSYSRQSQGVAENTLVLKVRSATLDDIPFILKGNTVIDEKSYHDAPPNPLNEARLKRDVFTPDNPRAYILIAEVDNQPAAFVMYSYCYFASEGEGIWLTNFYIDPHCRKGGIGKAIHDHMKILHPTTSGIYGAIASTNTIARHFFSGTGAVRYTDYIIYGNENDWGVVS